MLKNKLNLTIIGIVVIVLLFAGSYYLIFVKSSQSNSDKKPRVSSSVGPEILSPEDIGLKMTSSDDSKKVKFIIGNIQGIKEISYELTYEADSTTQERSEGGEDRIQRGITGEAEIDSDNSEYQSPWLDLGSCSKNVCRYDMGVSSVNLILKITKTDNKIYQAEDSLDL